MKNYNTRHISWDSGGIFCPLMLFFARWHVRSKKINRQWRESFCHNMGTTQGVPTQCDQDCSLHLRNLKEQTFLLTAASAVSIIVIRSSCDTLQQNGLIVIFKSCVLGVTRIAPRDKISRTYLGKVANMQDILHVYLTGLQFSVPLAPCNVTLTRRDGSHFAGYKACAMLK